ncbi:hypothetical protein LCGC14_2356170 [marine sediment metagenome]|uniref:Uncharacterized protein n=1 Tax=marine sediment metagenome TaxID=412755 RepID=A0A0F9C7P2_9ZZZZ
MRRSDIQDQYTRVFSRFYRERMKLTLFGVCSWCKETWTDTHATECVMICGHEEQCE